VLRAADRYAYILVVEALLVYLPKEKRTFPWNRLPERPRCQALVVEMTENKHALKESRAIRTVSGFFNQEVSPYKILRAQASVSLRVIVLQVHYPVKE
jgi:hypothetical protein